jgi:hypothetical protein
MNGKEELGDCVSLAKFKLFKKSSEKVQIQKKLQIENTQQFQNFIRKSAALQFIIN